MDMESVDKDTTAREDNSSIIARWIPFVPLFAVLVLFLAYVILDSVRLG